MFCGMSLGQRFEDVGVIAFGFQQLAQFLQHCDTMGRNGRISGQVGLGNSCKLGEQLLGLRVLSE